MARASLTAHPAVEFGKRPDWRDSQAFSGEFDVIGGNETRPWTGIDGSFGAISPVRRPETKRDVEGQPGRGGYKIINGFI